jgi:putative DNA primase/helicase
MAMMERSKPTDQERVQGALLAQELRVRLFEQGAYSELHGLRQWVNWSFEEIHGKLKKVPYNPGRAYRASPVNPLTWGTLTQALKRVELGYFSGIGFMVSAADPYCFVDLDERQDGVAKRITTPLGLQLFEMLDTITEFSPRYGLHFLVKLDKPVAALKSEVEIYFAERYLTITANLVPGSPTQIATRQAEVEALLQEFRSVERQVKEIAPTELLLHGHERAEDEVSDWRAMSPNRYNGQGLAQRSDEDVVIAASSAKNGAAFLELWEGRWQANAKYAGDQSRADLQLVKFLLYWTNNNAAQTNRLFEQSGLMRAKWRDRTNSGGGGHSYGEVTIYKAVQYRQNQGEK